MQLDTVADVADALDVYIEMRVRPQPKGKRARQLGCHPGWFVAAYLLSVVILDTVLA